MKARPSIYSRPNKPLFVAVPKRDHGGKSAPVVALAAPLMVHASSECHVTPPDVAARMVARVGGLAGRSVLEPSAGTGNLARAILAAGPVGSLTLVEMHCALAGGLHGLGDVVNMDFLEYARDTVARFDVIIMNPPFSKVRAHVAAARSLLTAGGVLVALVPVTFCGEDFQGVETLSNETFKTAKVSTKVVIFYA